MFSTSSARIALEANCGPQSCREDRRQGPRKQHQPQPNQRPSLAGIDGEIGQEGLGLECIENR